jgi:alkaline phosphatase D
MELDVVLHLGDAIYEFASGEYGTRRRYEPPHECRTLADYRMRHAQYRRDEDVQALHGAHALTMLWDDHEFANDAFEDGSYWHDAGTEGDWPTRRDGARRAFFEWMPVRESLTEPSRIYRTLELGSLLRIVLVDARMDGRSYQPFDVVEQYDENRRIVSPAQEAWLLGELARSDVRYRIVASQVLFAQHPEVWAMDAWEGYPVQRQRVLNAIAAQPQPTLLWVSGDSHASWTSELSTAPFDPTRYDPRTGLGAVGVELGIPGVSSPNLDPRDAPAEEERILRESPHHRYTEQSSRGFLVLDVDADRILGRRYFVDGVEVREGTLREGPVHELRAGSSRLTR